MNYGADMAFKTDITAMDKDSFQIFSGEEAVCLLQTVVENLMMGKFVGPIPWCWDGGTALSSPILAHARMRKDRILVVRLSYYRSLHYRL